MSITATSRSSVANARFASETVAHEAVTVSVGSDSRATSSMFRKSGWSSTIATRIGRPPRSACSLNACHLLRWTGRYMSRTARLVARNALITEYEGPDVTMPAENARASEVASNLRVLLSTATVLLTVFAVGATLQFEFVIREFVDLGPPYRLPERLVANFGSVATNAVLLWAFRVHAVNRGKWAWAGAVAAGGVAAVMRVVVQAAFGLHPDAGVVVWTTELLLGWAAATSSNGIALALTRIRRRA